MRGVPTLLSMACAGALGLAACGAEPEPPAWTSLARGFTPRTLEEVVAGWERGAPAPTGMRAVSVPFGLSLERPLPASEWQAAGTPGCLAVPLPPGAFLRSGVRPRLVGRGREYARVEAGRIPAQDEFRIEANRLTLRVAADMKRAPPTILVHARAGQSPAEVALPPSAWRTGELSGSFTLAIPKGASGVDPSGVRLFAGLVQVEEPRELAPFEYRVEEGRVVLCWPGEDRPSGMELVARLENGRDADGFWQVRLGRSCGLGIPVWSGAREELVTDLPGASELSFRFAHASRSATEPVRARVLLEAETLFEHRFDPGASAEAQPFAVALPPAGRAHARLVFEIEGPPGQGVFFAPTIGPVVRGTPGARPWPERPDFVVFLADTLRADALALYGGAPHLAPNLDRFAEGCLRFTRARSNAAWTLPSISSILTGIQPGQHGATDEDLVLSSALTTLPEHLARAGYRTGAITDGSFFAPIFGLDQGFEWFSEHDPYHWDLDRTVAEAREFLEHDDGRPVFLVVHTYRVHQPYRVGPEEDRTRYDEVLARVREATGTDSPGPEAGKEALSQVGDELRALYREGVRDLDRGFGDLVTWLEARRFFEHGTLVFTSDHGEALGERRDFFHGGHLWEPKLRVPLLLRGPGIAPRAVDLEAGPLDLAPTVAALAGLPPDPGWAGTSLLALDRDRPSFAFQLGARSRQVAFLDGTRKVIMTPDEARFTTGSCEEAFDLATDPLEETNLSARAEWPAELTRRLAPTILELMEPRGAPERAGVSPEVRAELDALGYGGEKE